MANIKKFDQEIRIIGNGVSMGNILTGLTSTGYGKFYSHSDEPWFANSTTTWKLADATGLAAVSAQTWTNVTDITTNVTNIATLSAATFNIGDGTNNSDIHIGYGDAIVITGGTDISVVYNSTTKQFEINNTAVASTNYYLSAATISNGEINFDMGGGLSDHTLDLKEALTLDQLSGVSTTGVADGDFLIYDITSGEWKASGITDDTLIAGEGINFVLGTGTVTINNDLMSAGTWKTTNGVVAVDTILWNETVTFSGGTGVEVLYNATSNVFTFNNTSSAAIVSIIANSGLTDYGTATDPIIGHTHSYSITNNITGLYVNDYVIDAYGHVSSVTPRDLTNELDSRYVNVTGDTMTGTLFINPITGSAIETQGDVKVLGDFIVTGDTTLYGNLFVSGTTTTIDVENLLVSDNIITVNAGEPTGAVSKGSAGIVVDRGTSSAYTFVYVEGTGVSAQTFRIGETTTDASGTTIESTHTQAVATRQDGMTNNSFLFWNGTESRIDGISAAPAANQVALYDGSDWTYTNLTAAAGIYSWNTISGDTGSITTTSVNDSFTIVGGSGLTTLAGSASVTINHDVIALTAPASSYANNEFIDTFTVDTTGHITSVTTVTRDYLSANTFYYATMSADTGSVAASSVADTFTILGGDGITTSIVGGNLVIDSDSSELVYTETIAASTTLTDSDTSGKNVAIVDYFSTLGQEGQIRILIASGDFTHDFQSGASEMTIDTVTITSNKIVLAQTGGSGTLSYTVKYI